MESARKSIENTRSRRTSILEFARNSLSLGRGNNQSDVSANVDDSFLANVDIVRSIMCKDHHPDEDLLVMEVSAQKTTHDADGKTKNNAFSCVTHNMNRWDLLVRCRDLVKRKYPVVPVARNAFKYRSEFFRALTFCTAAECEGGDLVNPSRMLERVRESKAMLHYRDLRCLQGITKPVMHIRKGCIVVSLDPIRAVITSSNMYLVLHEGQDSELQPLMPRLQTNDCNRLDCANQLPFELQALDAVLYTVFQWHQQRVRECSDLADVLVNDVRRSPTSKVLLRALCLDRSIQSELKSLNGLVLAVDEPQNDEDLMSHMCLSRLAATLGSVTSDSTLPSPPATSGGEDSIRAPTEGDDRTSSAAAYPNASKNPRSNDEKRGAGEEGRSGVGGWETGECEVLLDLYSMVFEGLQKHLKEQEQQLLSTKDLVRLQLKMRRNKIVAADMRFELAYCFIGIAYLVVSIFGQNLHSGYESHSTSAISADNTLEVSDPWLTVVVGSLAFAVICGAVCLCILQRSRRSY